MCNVQPPRLLPLAAILLLLAAPTGCPVGDNGDPNDPNGQIGSTDGPGPGGNGGSSPATFTFAVIGDYGDDDNDTREVANLIKGWNPDYVLTVGDNDYSDGAFRGTFEGLELGVGQYFHEYIGNYQGSRGAGSDVNRFFPIPGDHDWGDTCDDPAALDDYLAYFTLPAENSGNERYYDFRHGPVHFFMIDSPEGCEPDGVAADSKQALWVRDAAAASDATFKIAFSHHPPYSSGTHVGDGDHMRWPWKEWGVDMVIAGHDHDYERIERDGVRYIVNGLGGNGIRGFVEPVAGSMLRYADAHGAMRVRVFSDRLEAEFITVDGTVRDSFTIQSPGGTASGPLDPDAAPVTQGDWYRPPVGATWQWQLQPTAGGKINTSYDVTAYDIDLFDASAALIDELHAAGRKVICYFSAGTYEDFRADSGEFLSADLGAPLGDFPDERWIDIRSSNVHRIILARLDLAMSKGCDCVEPDNVDGYANDHGFAVGADAGLTATDQLAFNRFLANESHKRGLSVGLKNDLDQIPQLVEYFDFSVNEQCFEFDECDLLKPFTDAGKPVFSAEYASRFVNNAADRDALCADARNRNLRTLVLPLDLDDSLRFSCDP
jgi:hypothetical protein